jgi:MoaA/NifB/PqqE/SkfB family radical SAM enzyme
MNTTVENQWEEIPLDEFNKNPDLYEYKSEEVYTNPCYDSVKKLTDRGMNQINIHQLISEETYEQVLETISDMKSDSRLEKMNAIVFLSLKQKGRGTKYNPLAFDKFKILLAVKDTAAYKQFEISAEPCESSLFSTYIDVDGKFHPCSFSPNTELWGEEGIDVASCNDFLKDIWFNEKTAKFREALLQGHRNCPFYKI